jgi:hypothetical protein
MVEPLIEFELDEWERKEVAATATIQTSEIRRLMYLLLFKAVDIRRFGRLKMALGSVGLQF